MKKNEGKIPVKVARKFLGEDGQDLSNDKVKEVMDFMWNWAEDIEFEHFIKTQNHE
ncbi:MAG: hypothetical protein ACTSXE_03275 [Candidatus Thorarchaeota archaeon]